MKNILLFLVLFLSIGCCDDSASNMRQEKRKLEAREQKAREENPVVPDGYSYEIRAYIGGITHGFYYCKEVDSDYKTASDCVEITDVSAVSYGKHITTLVFHSAFVEIIKL